jgi:hypothetical protein
MKYILLPIFLAISSIAYSQDTLEIISVKSGSMNDLPFSVSDKEHVINFGFSGMANDMYLEISLWGTTPNADSLSKVILFNENLMKKERPRMDLLVDQDGKQVNITSILAGVLTVVSPVKPQNHRIQAFIFKSKPKIEEKNVPVVLLIDSDKENLEGNIADLLTSQDIKFIKPQTIRNLKKEIGEFKILTYYLKVLP